MSLLNGGLEAIFGAAFGGLYLDGVLHRDGTGPVYDGAGNIVGYDGGADVPIKVQNDKAGYDMRKAEGYAEGDVALIVLSEGLAEPITTDHQITDGYGARWAVQTAERDTGASHWICRGRVA